MFAASVVENFLVFNSILWLYNIRGFSIFRTHAEEEGDGRVGILQFTVLDSSVIMSWTFLDVLRMAAYTVKNIYKN